MDIETGSELSDASFLHSTFGGTISDTDEKLKKWRDMNQADSTLYANVLIAADYLGCDELCNDLLHSFDDLGTDPLGTIRSCYEIVPNFASMLFYNLGFPNVAACDTFLKKLVTANAQELSYSELQLCDGKYFVDAATYKLSDPLKIEPSLASTLSTEFQSNMIDDVKEKGLGDAKSFKICTHLNLKKWTNTERLRRHTELDAAKRYVSNNRKSFEHWNVLDQKLWNAVAQDNLIAAKEAYTEGACPDLWFAAGVAMRYGERDSTECSGEEYETLINKDLSLFLEDAPEPHLMAHGLTTLMKASQNNSLATMNWLIDVGCRVNNFHEYVGNKGGTDPADDYDDEEDEIKFYSLAIHLGKVLFRERDVSVMLRDTGDAKYSFGNAPALVCATTPEAIQLLLARGAKSNAWYAPPSCNKSMLGDSCTILATHLKLRHGSDRNMIARALVRHGANVNEICYCCFDVVQNSTWKNRCKDSPVAYWPSVVASGDISWAKQLVEQYDANVNWPNETYNTFYHTYIYNTKFTTYNWNGQHVLDLPLRKFEHQKITGLGATVLQIAIIRDDVAMVKFLLKPVCEEDWDKTIYVKSCNVNGLESVSFSGPQNVSMEPEETCHAISHAQRQHYWGVNSWKDINKVAVQKNKLATSMSVARAVGNKVIIALLKDAGATCLPENATVPVMYEWTNLK